MLDGERDADGVGVDLMYIGKGKSRGEGAVKRDRACGICQASFNLTL